MYIGIGNIKLQISVGILLGILDIYNCGQKLFDNNPYFHLISHCP